MYHHLVSFYLLFLTSVYNFVIPANTSRDSTGATTPEQPGLQLPTNQSSLTSGNWTVGQNTNSYLHARIADGIQKFYDRRSKTYDTIELYKIIVSSGSRKPTKDVTTIQVIKMNFRGVSKRTKDVAHSQWYYNYKHQTWTAEGSPNAWSEEAEFKASDPIVSDPKDWSSSGPIDFQKAVRDMNSAPGHDIPDSRLHGPWEIISIVKYKQTPDKFSNELILRFEAPCLIDGSVPSHYAAFDVLVGASSGEATLVPPEYDFLIPKNPWGWGQDNRRSLPVIGPYTDFEYLVKGVDLVTKTMGNGWYRDAQLIQIKIRNPKYPRPEDIWPGVQPQQYNAITLFFTWGRGYNQKLLKYTAVSSYKLDDLGESGNRWASWDVIPSEIDWRDRRDHLKFMNAGDAARYLDPINIADLHMSILEAFARWRYYTTERKVKNWSIQDHLWICKPNYNINDDVKDQIVYYFPFNTVLGTISGKYAQVDYSTIASNQTDLTTYPVKVDAVT